ncbi:MAG TPA: hypothetical protein VFI57_03480 [Pyrinomonadaceae bacterium]|nr:hypothetical protein [Pyrinomonadaceae bacterium]
MIRSATLRSIFLVLALATAGCAQTALNYGFVSPNTKENLKLEDAIKGMKSTEETKLVQRSINLGCVVRSRIRAFRSLGSWSDGAEHSVMVRVQSDEPTVRYVLSRLGRDARQKSILYFHPQTAGAADLYTLKPRRPMRNLAALAQTLERAGIAFRTLVPVKSGTWIYIVDLKRELRAKVMDAAKRLRARVNSESGDAGFIGDDQPDDAKVVFDEEIRKYETQHPNLPPTCDVQKATRRTASNAPNKHE